MEKIDEVDISILQRNPILDSSIILEIQPLAPLSMVSELPGSYYKTLKMPDKKMLCGLFENILGWHIDLADREKIFKEVKTLRERKIKAQAKSNGKNETLFGIGETISPATDYTKGSTYKPLLMDYFEIEKCVPKFKNVVFYDDLWKKAYRRADADVHPKGTTNLSHELISEKREWLSNDDNTLLSFFKNNIDKFPLYYSSPTKREYLSMRGSYLFEIHIDKKLCEMLCEKVATENLGYLGNSEGWVNLIFKEI
jgi:CRISPR-associated protein Cas5